MAIRRVCFAACRHDAHLIGGSVRAAAAPYAVTERSKGRKASRVRLPQSLRLPHPLRPNGRGEGESSGGGRASAVSRGGEEHSVRCFFLYVRTAQASVSVRGCAVRYDRMAEAKTSVPNAFVPSALADGCAAPERRSLSPGPVSASVVRPVLSDWLCQTGGVRPAGGVRQKDARRLLPKPLSLPSRQRPPCRPERPSSRRSRSRSAVRDSGAGSPG